MQTRNAVFHALHHVFSPVFFFFYIYFIFSDCTGNNFFWCWLLVGCHRMAYFGHDFGGIWIHRTLQVCRSLTFMIVAVIFVITHFNCYWNMFCSGFWPTLAVFLQKIPILGWLFQQPYIRSVCLFWKKVSFYCYLFQILNCKIVHRMFARF